ncbi:hypothetical protein [Rhizobium leguminosarum]|uniref:hypothetical protein n=1 Tax=Rhizobium leguminosarum TaxID=384 RepID=UPI00198148E4|nr:hypothetical protein [Rhizobium leguminosarum]
MSVLPDQTLPDSDYPFIDQRYPLAELAMIEVPEGIQKISLDQAEKNGEAIMRDAPSSYGV